MSDVPLLVFCLEVSRNTLEGQLMPDEKACWHPADEESLRMYIHIHLCGCILKSISKCASKYVVEKVCLNVNVLVHVHVHDNVKASVDFPANLHANATVHVHVHVYLYESVYVSVFT